MSTRPSPDTPVNPGPAADTVASHRPLPDVDALLHEVVETLATIVRPPCSPGEREAAEWIAERLSDLGCDVQIDDELAYQDYARPLTALTAIGAVGGLAALTRRGRPVGMLLGALAGAAIAEDISNGPRLFRRLTMSRKPTCNVLATAGDRNAHDTLVVLAHHDSAPTGAIFDQSLQSAFSERFPGIVERIDTAPPLWWPVVGFPLLVALGAARRSRPMIRTGLAGCLLGAAAFADIARSPTVPGANDNLSAVAALFALASILREQPIAGLRLLLVSCGAEEALQGGIRPFAARHFPSLDRDRTWVLNLDTIGSPTLTMLEGEGPLVMEDYHARSFRDLVAHAAERVGVPLRRGMRARSSTDSVIPSRAGYPTATLVSINRYKALSNYHLPSDIPENLDYRTVARAVAVVHAVAQVLAERLP
jgi:Peptidase family M28